MTLRRIQTVATETSPGAFRAVALDQDARPVRLFSQRWSGQGERARFGTIHEARLRGFADELRGAFCQLATGEEVFLRLSSRDGLTEGAALRVMVESEKRAEKLARVSITEADPSPHSAFEDWQSQINAADRCALREDRDAVAAAFADALAPSVTLPNGGTLHISRTRALTAVDVDTAGRRNKGSAGARALAINRDAVTELARQAGLRGLGGLMVLDCVSPLNTDAAARLHQSGRAAFQDYGLEQARLLKPSALGLLELALPWRVQPLADADQDCPGETELLDLLRDVQREADGARHKFIQLALCAKVWRAYEMRRRETDQALTEMFSGRVTVVRSGHDKNEVIPS